MKKILLISATLWATSAQAIVVNVTTKADENGENPAACSLREAIRAIEDAQAFGGCMAGSGNKDVIQLVADKESDGSVDTPYELNASLVIRKGLSIFGAETVKVKKEEDDPEIYNPVNGAKSVRSQPLTTIKISSTLGQRLFLMTDGDLLRLKDVKLLGGVALANNRGGNGGAIWAVSEIVLDNVHIQGGLAQGGAGAIFLAGPSNPLTISNTTLLGNQADQGAGAIAMTCFANGVATAHNVAIDLSSLQGNISGSGAAAVVSCGNSSLTITNSTITGNTKGLAYRNGAGTSVPAQLGSMTLTHVSVVDNLGCGIDLLDAQTCTYSDESSLSLAPTLGGIALTNSVVAFNQGGDCAGVAKTVTTAQRNKTGEQCELTELPPEDPDNPPTTPPVNEQQNALLNSGGSIDAQFEALGLYGGLTLGFLPKSASLLVGAVTSACSSTDQRGAPRNPGEVTTCDAGSMERKTQLAVDDKGTNTKDGGFKRKVVVDVLANDIGSENGQQIFRPVSFEITEGGCQQGSGEELGKLVFEPATDAETGLGKPSVKDEPYTCKYRMYDGLIDADGNRLPNTVASNEATVELTVANLAPEALGDRYTRPHDGNPFAVFPLLNDKDVDGLDGKLPRDGLADKPREKLEVPDFCPGGTVPGECVSMIDNTAALTTKDCAGFGPFIKISKQPELGTISGTITATVISGVQRVPYYGSRLVYTPRNSYSPFTDSFSYVVVDADCQESNEAAVRIAVDVPPEGQGGGAMGFWLLGALGLLGLRRRPQL